MRAELEARAAEMRAKYGAGAARGLRMRNLTAENVERLRGALDARGADMPLTRAEIIRAARALGFRLSTSTRMATGLARRMGVNLRRATNGCGAMRPGARLEGAERTMWNGRARSVRERAQRLLNELWDEAVEAEIAATGPQFILSCQALEAAAIYGVEEGVRVNTLATVAKIASEFGAMGVLAVGMVLIYRLADKFGAAFLAGQASQTAAMSQQASAVASLVETVKEGQHDQREVLMAVRSLSDRIDRQGKYLEVIEQCVREGVR